MSRLEVRTEEYRKEAAKLLGPDNKKVVLEMRRDLRAAAKPVGDRILAAIADAMPKGGGLADKVRSQGRVSLLVDLRRGVKIQLANKLGMRMGPFEDGSIRHPSASPTRATSGRRSRPPVSERSRSRRRTSGSPAAISTP